MTLTGSVTELQTFPEAKTDFDWRTNPDELLGQETTTLLPTRAMRSERTVFVGAMGRMTTLNVRRIEFWPPEAVPPSSRRETAITTVPVAPALGVKLSVPVE